MTTTCDVAVVGAGPTGLTLANLLGAAGVRTALVEQNLTTVREPRAVSIDDESMRTLQAIGLDDELIGDLVLETGYHYFGPGGSCFLKVEPSERPYGFPRRSNVQQPDLEATLRTGLGRFPQVTQLFRHACEHVQEDDLGVTLSVRGPEGEDVSIRAAYLAGCDGARSSIRQAIGSTLTGSSYEQRWLIVDLATTKEKTRHSRVFCDPARPGITVAGPHGVRRYEFMLHAKEGDEVATSPAFVRTLLASHGPDADEPIVRQQVYTFHARLADRWQTRRVFLAGDAAHLSPPFAGQGMNAGIRDAHNLGWKLAEVLGGRLGPGLLETYAAERAPHASALIQLAVTIGRVMMPTSSLQAALVRLGFRVSSLVPRVQTYFAEMQYKPKPFYGAGFLVPGGHASIVGRMLPQPMLKFSDTRRVMLDDLLGREFGLIAYGAAAEQILATAASADFGVSPLKRLAILPLGVRRPGRAVNVSAAEDVDDTLAGICRPDDGVLIVVRPDRYVAAAVAVGSDPGAIASFAESVQALVADTRQKSAAAARFSGTPVGNP